MVAFGCTIVICICPIHCMLFVLCLQKRTPLEVSMLQFFYAYLQRYGATASDGAPAGNTTLRDTWPSLLALLREGQTISLPAQGHFMLLA